MAKPYRGCGAGRLLVRWIERLARKASLDCLLVAAGTDVVKFWGKLGYAAVPADVPEAWASELHARFEKSCVMHRALPADEGEAGVRQAIEHLEQAHAKRRRR